MYLFCFTTFTLCYFGICICDAAFVFLISNFRPVLNAVCFLLGNSPASEFYMPTFRNTVCSIFIGRWVWRITTRPWRWNRQCSEMLAYKFRCRRITQKKAYNKTPFFFARSRNIIAVYSDIQMKRINTLCEQNVELVIIVTGYTVP